MHCSFTGLVNQVTTPLVDQLCTPPTLPYTAAIMVNQDDFQEIVGINNYQILSGSVTYIVQTFKRLYFWYNDNSLQQSTIMANYTCRSP